MPSHHVMVQFQWTKQVLAANHKLGLWFRDRKYKRKTIKGESKIKGGSYKVRKATFNQQSSPASFISLQAAQKPPLFWLNTMLWAGGHQLLPLPPNNRLLFLIFPCPHFSTACQLQLWSPRSVLLPAFLALLLLLHPPSSSSQTAVIFNHHSSAARPAEKSVLLFCRYATLWAISLPLPLLIFLLLASILLPSSFPPLMLSQPHPLISIFIPLKSVLLPSFLQLIFLQTKCFFVLKPRFQVSMKGDLGNLSPLKNTAAAHLCGAWLVHCVASLLHDISVQHWLCWVPLLSLCGVPVICVIFDLRETPKAP